VQVLVYAGAIMVVFLFVVMLLNLGTPEELSDLRAAAPRLTAGRGHGLLANLLAAGASRHAAHRGAWNRMRQRGHRPVAESLFTEYLLAFELTSIVLLVADRRRGGARQTEATA
jgi:NADH-quinone oxidoreductase subunit J